MQVTFETRARSAAHFCPFVKPFSEKFVGDFVKNESLSPVFSRDRDSERLFQIHGGMGDPKFLIGVDRRTQKLFTFQLPRDLAGTHTASAHSEDSVDNGGGFLIYHQPVSVILAAPVAIGRSGPQALPSFSLCPEYGPHLAAGVPNIPIINIGGCFFDENLAFLLGAIVLYLSRKHFLQEARYAV